MSNSAAAGVGLCVPTVFYGGEAQPSHFAALRRMLDDIGDVTHPHNPWYVTDNLLTYAHTRGFLTEPRFVNAVVAAQPRPEELALAWRTHTLCWAAESSRAIEGAFVECGT